MFVCEGVTNSCVYLLIKNLLPNSGCCFVVCFEVVTQNGSMRYSIYKYNWNIYRQFVTVLLCDSSLCLSLGPFVVRLLLWLPHLSLCCPPSPCSWAPSLLLHCTPSLSRGCREVMWEGRIIVVAGASRQGSFHQWLLRCRTSREKSGVAGFCSVMVEMSSYLGSYGPGSCRAGGSLRYSHVHHFKTALSVIVR
jgi:hypothetical protein